jgi:hypothetical protein
MAQTVEPLWNTVAYEASEGVRSTVAHYSRKKV